MSRQRLLTDVGESMVGLAFRRIVRVGVDGVDGAGKTTFADELAQALEQRGRQVIRASVDRRGRRGVRRAGRADR
jgi:uridine kinase